MKSNVTVGPPIDLMAYSINDLDITRHKRFDADDPGLLKIRGRWEQALRQAVLKLPDVRFKAAPPVFPHDERAGNDRGGRKFTGDSPNEFTGQLTQNQTTPTGK